MHDHGDFIRFPLLLLLELALLQVAVLLSQSVQRETGTHFHNQWQPDQLQRCPTGRFVGCLFYL